MNGRAMRNLVEEWENKYLSKYFDKYDIANTYYTENLKYSDRLGETSWSIYNEGYSFVIKVNDIFIDDDLTTKVILWHEFAHVMDVVKNGNGGHDKGWIKEWFRKPLWTIPAYILIAPIVIWRFIEEDLK